MKGGGNGPGGAIDIGEEFAKVMALGGIEYGCSKWKTTPTQIASGRTTRWVSSRVAECGARNMIQR